MMIFFIIFGILLLVFLLYIACLVNPGTRQIKNTRILCNYAHRGLHDEGVPENSLQAFEKACEGGYGIELDVQLSGDGTVMVFHDYTLNRMTEKEGKLCDFSKEELASLTLADSNQHIPTFKEALGLVNGRVPILIELKGESLDTRLCDAVAKELEGYSGDYCIESFNPFLLYKMRKLLQGVYYGQLYTNVCRDKKNCNPLNVLLTAMVFNCVARPDFIAYNKEDRDSLPVKITTRLYKKSKFVWTIKNGDTPKPDERTIFERQ